MNKPYLTEEEYKDMGFAELSDPVSFNKMLRKASAVIDNLTMRHYEKVLFEDSNKYVVKKFKEAIAVQIEYFNDNNATTTSKLNDKPLTQQIGRVSISRGSKGQTTDSSGDNSIVCPDVYIYLEGTGLLSRGLGRC